LGPLAAGVAEAYQAENQEIHMTVELALPLQD
jgi:hypothetical protein